MPNQKLANDFFTIFRDNTRLIHVFITSWAKSIMRGLKTDRFGIEYKIDK